MILRYLEFVENWVAPSKAINMSDKELSNSLPAIKHKKSGKVYVGKQGDYHADIASRTKSPHGKHWLRGFYSKKKKGFHDDSNDYRQDAVSLGNQEPEWNSPRLNKAMKWNDQREKANS